MPSSRSLFVLGGALLLGWAPLVGCAATQQIERMGPEGPVLGRRVGGMAFSWYVRGQQLERQREWERAEHAYAQAVLEDARSGSAWAALGRVRCVQQLPTAEDTFREARLKAEEVLPVLVEQGRCALLRNSPAEAVQLAHLALEVSPEDPAPSRLLRDAYLARGDHEAARNVERGYETFTGEPLIAAAPQLTAEHQLLTTADARRLIDDALRRGDLGSATRAATSRVGPGEIALRAALLGQLSLAALQGEHALLLDPEDGDAWVALLWAHGAELAGSDVPFLASARMPSPPIVPRAPSRLGQIALALHLALRTNATAARAALEGLPEAREPGDALLNSLEHRLSSYLEAP